VEVAMRFEKVNSLQIETDPELEALLRAFYAADFSLFGY
jgi:hypothetical protein